MKDKAIWCPSCQRGFDTSFQYLQGLAEVSRPPYLNFCLPFDRRHLADAEVHVVMHGTQGQAGHSLVQGRPQPLQHLGAQHVEDKRVDLHQPCPAVRRQDTISGAPAHASVACACFLATPGQYVASASSSARSVACAGQLADSPDSRSRRVCLRPGTAAAGTAAGASQAAARACAGGRPGAGAGPGAARGRERWRRERVGERRAFWSSSDSCLPVRTLCVCVPLSLCVVSLANSVCVRLRACFTIILSYLVFRLIAL